MAGLYLHIPFCRRACTYCDFYFSTNLRTLPRFVDALLQEVALWANQGTPWLPTPLRSVYLGGGTPSLLPVADLARVLQALQQTWPWAPEAEVTLELNPEQATPAYLAQLRALGVNRASLGVQTFQDPALLALGRTHTSAQAHQALEAVAQAGFRSWTADLMYGLPGVDEAAWAEDVANMLAHQPPHISAYALMLEPGTALHQQVGTGRVTPLPDEATHRQHHHLAQQLQAAGYRHYELSNFASPGHQARHNTAYWLGEPYLGLGPSAHSYDGQRRWWNHANLHRYNQALEAGESPVADTETLTPHDRLNERLMTRLRLDDGLPLADLHAPGLATLPKAFWQAVDEQCRAGLLHASTTHLRLTPLGKPVADHVIRALFCVEGW